MERHVQAYLSIWSDHWVVEVMEDENRKFYSAMFTDTPSVSKILHDVGALVDRL